MSTFLFDQIIFGPIQSRRLGISLGVNLLPTDSKICSFNCIYCECGWTPKKQTKKAVLPSRKEVAEALEKRLLKMIQDQQLPDVITFAGNGEPTLHPEFAEIIDDTVRLRNTYTPNCKIAVLSNATRIIKPTIFDSLLKIDDNILKLDSAIEETVRRIDCPIGNFDLQRIILTLSQFREKAIIQTLFLRGTYNNETIDNTTEEEILAWLKAIKQIQPGKVMVYSLARDTPADHLEKVSHEELCKIASRVKKLGIEVQVS